jgi:hypothetical protein
MYPVSAYCRRPGGVRVPAPSTLERLCSTPAHTGCQGFLATQVGSSWWDVSASPADTGCQGLDQDARADGC